MKIRALRVRNIGPFGDEGCALEDIADGLNVVREANEAGKTTLFRALKLILFDAHNSKKQHIKNLRCDRGTGAPYVELDLEIDGKLFRLVKQFLNREMAAVIDPQTDQRIAEKKEAEDWIAERLGSDNLDSSSPGLLWIEQGDSLTQPTSRAGAGRELFDSLEGEIESVVGGEQANRVLERAKSRLAEYLTPTGAPRAKLKAAMQEAAQLREEAGRLKGQVAATEESRRELVNVEERLSELNEKNETAHHNALAAAREALSEANKAEEKVAGLLSAKEAAALEATLATRDRDALQEREGELAKLKEKRANKQEEAKEARQKADDLETNLKTERVRVKGLKTSYDDAKDAVAKGEETAQKIATDEQRKKVSQALREAREIDRNLRAAKEKASETLPDLKDLEAAHEELIQRRSAAQAARPSLRVEAAAAPVELNGDVVEAGQPVLLSGQSRLAYQDLTLVIETPDREGTEEALELAEERLQALLAEYEVEAVTEARTLHEARLRARDDADRLLKDLQSIAPNGIAALETERDAIGEANSADAGDLEPPDMAALSAARDEAEFAWNEANGELGAAEQNLRDKRSNIRALEDQVRDITDLIKPIEVELGPAEERAENTRAQRALCQEKLENVRRAEKQYNDAIEDQPRVDAAQARVKRLEDAERNRSTERAQLSEQRGQLMGQLKQAGQDGAEEKLADIEATLKRAESREEAYSKESQALSLLIKVVETATSERRQQYFQPVKAVVNPLVSQVLGRASVSFDDDLGPARIERNGVEEQLERLSGGTREQIAVLTRLAFAKVMADKGVHVPVLFDDALVYSDDDRIQKMFDVINLVASEIQVLAFSCRQKTFEDLGGTHVYKTKFPLSLEHA